MISCIYEEGRLTVCCYSKSSLMSVQRWQIGSLNISLSPSVQSETRLDYSSYEGIPAQSKCVVCHCATETGRGSAGTMWITVETLHCKRKKEVKEVKSDRKLKATRMKVIWSDDVFCVLLQTHVDIFTQFPLQGSIKSFWCWLCWGDFLWWTERTLQHFACWSVGGWTNSFLQSHVSFASIRCLLTSRSFILLLCAGASSHRWTTFHSGHETNQTKSNNCNRLYKRWMLETEE